MSTTSLAPVIRSVEVDAPLDHAFHVFTEEFDSWWPTQTYSIGGEQVKTAAIEPRVGGRVYERWHDGRDRLGHVPHACRRAAVHGQHLLAVALTKSIP